ncbi:ethylene-responsive nuclear protein -related [Raphanus sativus]|nr:ethylene-responsive nuclear protein -related [Raphanus sativus]
MSLLWKKPKSGRLSRFMSEFHKSPKLGRIMVVETGFPTSLIDLFFKNRDRPKKYATKTKRIQRLIETAPIASLPVNPDVSLEKPVTRRSKIEKVRRKHTSENNVCVCGDGTGAFVLMAFKLFIVASGGATPWSGGSHDPHAPPLIVAVLALSTTKSLTMGIALCAFALLFTENVATRILTRLKLCNTDARKEKPLASTHDDKLISCSEETETIAVTNNSNSNDSRIRDDLSLKDEKVRSKSSRLKSKILKKLRSYKKKKDKTIVVNQVVLA